MTPRDQIRAALLPAARSLGATEGVDPVLERPRDPTHGDWSTNLAMALARPLKRKPREIAQELVRALDLGAAGVERVDIAGPGFINFYLTAGANASGLADIVTAGDAFGRTDAGRGDEVVVEFVSANPTGPLHVGHGRQAAIGDAIASLLEWNGWTVAREYYYNDAGAQIEKLGMSVQARRAQMLGRDVAMEDGWYLGDYVREIAEQYALMHPNDASASDLEEVTRFAVQAMRREQDLDLQAFGLGFDTYYLESSLYSDGMVTETVSALVNAGHTYEKDGALWLRTTDFGDDKDRVMRKQDGYFTYFVPDVAYHVSKWRRGFRRAINVQGSDHHNQAVRVRIGLQALDMGMPADYPEYVFHTMVKVMRGGEEVKISKRAGDYVTLRDLIDWVGRDAVRYFFLVRKGDTPLEFDVDLARSQSEENPIYYIQMAHARMRGIFRVGEIDPSSVRPGDADLALLAQPEERELIKALLDFPALLQGAAEALEPHRVANYLLDTAKLAHLWYHKHHVLGEAPELTRARLLLARATQVVLRNGLAVLGVSAPERM